MPTNLRFIITGGPGFGKTTLIHALDAEGIPVFAEGASELIRDGYQVPIRSEETQKWAFFRQIRERRVNDYHRPDPLKISFYDRGLPDSIAFTRFMNGTLPEGFLSEIVNLPYNRHVFITPIWPEIFTSDHIRTESLEMAEQLHHLIIETYISLGYTLIELPKTTTSGRVSFIKKVLRGLLGDKMINDIALLK